MSTTPEHSGVKRPFQRPVLEATGPDRRARGFYKTADSEDGALAGVTLDNAEDVAVAAVRLGYKIAAAQVERSTRLAQRLRGAGQRALGPDAERQTLDATERLLFDSMVAGLAWLEGVAANPSSPLKRLAVAEYRLLGSLFGLTADGDAAGKPEPVASATDEVSDSARKSPAQTRGTPARIFLRGEERRAVRLKGWEIQKDLPASELRITFYAVEKPEAEPLEGSLLAVEIPPILNVTTRQLSPAGPWRAAVCLPEGELVGIIEVEL
jgi:hypothetical protein